MQQQKVDKHKVQIKWAELVDNFVDSKYLHFRAVPPHLPVPIAMAPNCVWPWPVQTKCIINATLLTLLYIVCYGPPACQWLFLFSLFHQFHVSINFICCTIFKLPRVLACQYILLWPPQIVLWVVCKAQPTYIAHWLYWHENIFGAQETEVSVKW